MNTIISYVINLVISLLIAWLVWRFYNGRLFPASEKYQTFGPRFWTGSVDACVLWPVGFVAVILLSLALPAVVAAVIIIAQHLAWLLYTVHMHAKYGQTYGKMVTKVRVVDARSEGPISYRQALLREGIPLVTVLALLFYEIWVLLTTGHSLREPATTPVSFEHNRVFWSLKYMPVFWFSAEVLTMLTNAKSRALHDYIAGTVVIRTNLG